MIELLEAAKANNIYSSLIRHSVDGETLKLRFGIEQSDYSRLKRILDFRPFEDSGVAPYRYFFTLSYRNNPDNEKTAFISIRVEQLCRHKQYEFELGKNYISNLLWFDGLKETREIEELIEK